ncbi:MAG: hypothetical protein MJE77_36485, partial [Proteobacteria bacterium]|nr:hypothetical protein [Pseudomonadota bacterium]
MTHCISLLFALLVLSIGCGHKQTSAAAGTADYDATKSLTLPVRDYAEDVRLSRTNSALTLSLLAQTPEYKSLAFTPACRSGGKIDVPAFHRLSRHLNELHGKIYRKATPLSQIQNVSPWVEVAPASNFYATLIRFDQNISAGLGLQFGPIDLSSKAAQGRVEIDLALVTYNRSAKLTRFARDCVSENVCAANAEGAWIDKIYFGSLIRFNIDKKKLEAALKTKATGRAKAEFSYARSNLNIAG